MYSPLNPRNQSNGTTSPQRKKITANVFASAAIALVQCIKFGYWLFLPSSLIL
jgi:hypothetical protein